MRAPFRARSSLSSPDSTSRRPRDRTGPMRSAVVIFGFALAALPLSFLARAEPPAGETLPSAFDAGAPIEPPPAGYPPDPIPLVTRHQWVIDLRYRSGTVTYGGARRVELAS